MILRDVATDSTTVPSARAAVVGADRSVAEIVATLSSGGSVFVVGTLGSGKSFLIEAVTAALIANGRTPLVVRAAAALTATAFAALRTNPRVAQLVDGAPGGSPDGPAPVLVVDDGHLLDVSSARWLAQAVHTGRVTALVVGAPSSSAEAKRAQPDTLTELDELWISGHANRVDLRPLSFAEAEDLIEAEAGHGVVDRIRRADLYRASGGSRLFLIEMIRSLASDSSASFSGIRISNRIRDVLRYQLSALSPSQRECLALVSRLGGVTRPRLARVVEARAIDRLLEKGHLVPDAGDPDMLRATSIFATLHDSIGETDDIDDLVDALGDILPAEASLSAQEASEIAMRWSFDGRLPKAVDTHGADVVCRVVLTASAEATEDGRFRDALMLAQMAESVAPTSDAHVSASRALAGLRQDDEAIDILASAAPLVRSDAEGMRLFQWWSALLIGLARLDDVATATAAAEEWPEAGPLLRGEIRAARVQVAYLSMQWDDVARDAWSILDDPSCALSTRVRAGVEAAAALAYRGDVEAAFQCLELVRRVNTDPVTNAPIDELSRVALISGEAMLRVPLGRCMRDLLGEVESILTRTGPRPPSTMLAFLAYTGAVADLFRGDLPATDLEYRSAVARFTTAESSGWRSGVHCEHALVLALLGDAEGAGAALRQAESLGVERSPTTRHLYLRGQFAAVAYADPEVTAGSIDLARRLLAASAGSPVLHAVDLYLVLIHGSGTDDDRRTLQRIVGEVAYPLGSLFEQHLVAREAGVGKDLETVAGAFAALGAYLLAIRAQGDAVQVLESEGNALRVAQARRQLAAYTALSRQSDSPEAESTASRLSERERQVAVLVAEGLSNRQIADRLFLSVRTVESHIYQARLKLGAPTRRGLADVLGSAL